VCKLSETQHELIFFQVLDGSSMSALAEVYKVSHPSIHNSFWKTYAKVLYLDGSITYQRYHEHCCNVDSVKALTELYTVRLNKARLKQLFESQKQHKVSDESPLMYLKLRPSVLKVFVEHGISTIGCYKRLKNQKFPGIGRDSKRSIDLLLEAI